MTTTLAWFFTLLLMGNPLPLTIGAFTTRDDCEDARTFARQFEQIEVVYRCYSMRVHVPEVESPVEPPDKQA